MENTKKCPYCGEEIKAEAKKCRYCGEWLNIEQPSVIKEMIQCPICGEEIAQGTEYCPYCHEKVDSPSTVKKSDESKVPSVTFLGIDNSTEKRRLQKKIIIYGSIFIFLAIIIFFSIYSNRHNGINNTSISKQDTAECATDSSSISSTNQPMDILLDASNDDRHCIYYTNDTCCIKFDTQSNESSTIININQGSLDPSELKDADGQELTVFTIAAKKIDSSNRYIVFVLDRQSNEMESYDFIEYDTKAEEYRYLARSYGIYKDISDYFDGDKIVVLETKPINTNADCAADYIYEVRKSYYDFDGNYLYQTPWERL